MLTVKRSEDERGENPYAPLIPESLSGKLIILSLFIMFLIVTSHKLTNTSLWFDEGVEYWVSIQPFGRMIALIKKTLQPPLYNFIMYFLLKISISEYWFRLTSVLFGFLGCVGLYAAVNEACGWKMAGTSIFIYSFLSTIIYYNQECSEYTLLMCNLFWVVYFYICLLKHFSTSKLIGYTSFCVLSMYSQYGAVFPLVGMSVSLFLFYLEAKRIDVIKELVIIMGTAASIFGLVLYFVFLSVQREGKGTTGAPFENMFAEIQGFVANMKSLFSFFFPSHFGNKIVLTIIELIYILSFVFIIWAIVQKKDKKLKFVGISSLATYLLFFIMVRTGAYAIASYSSSRHSLAVFPILFVGICVSGYTLFQIVQVPIRKKSKALAYTNALLILILLSVNNYINWQTIKYNWEKEDLRSSFNLWLDETGGTEKIYLYYAAIPAFVFYAENSGLDYGKDIVSQWWIVPDIPPSVTQYKNFHYGESMRGKDIDYMKNSIQESFSNDMPDNLWFISSHIHSDIQTYMDAFAEMGYYYQVYLWNNEGLLWFYNDSYIEKNYQPAG